MVRLLPLFRIKDEGDQKSFNPTMVRLLRVGGGGGRCAHECFNPTMVRLLP